MMSRWATACPLPRGAAMNQQCYQCHTAHDDNALTAVSGVWLCPKCKSNPSVAVQTYGMLVQQLRAGDVDAG